MEKLINGISVTIGVLGGILASIVGGFDKLAIVFLAFISIDYLTGIMKAIYKKELSSSIGYKGIIKKISMIICVGVAVLLEENMGIPALREILLCFFISNEGISLLENIAELDVKLPKNLKNALLQVRKGEE